MAIVTKEKWHVHLRNGEVLEVEKETGIRLQQDLLDGKVGEYIKIGNRVTKRTNLDDVYPSFYTVSE